LKDKCREAEEQNRILKFDWNGEICTGWRLMDKEKIA
jgi:hypothetical protein